MKTVLKGVLSVAVEWLEVGDKLFASVGKNVVLALKQNDVHGGLLDLRKSLAVRLIYEKDIYLARSQGGEDGGGELGFRNFRFFIVRFNFVESFIRDSKVSKLDDRAAIGFCEVLSESDVRNADVGSKGDGLLRVTSEFKAPT